MRGYIGARVDMRGYRVVRGLEGAYKGLEGT